MGVDTRLVIIGSGPAAWSAAIYAGRADIKPLVFTGETPGGQLMLTTDVENFPGFVSGIDGPMLMNQMREQAVKFNVTIKDEKVVRIKKEDDLVRVYSDSGEYLTEAVVIATGAQARWLNVPGERELMGKGVSACAVCDAAFFRNKNVVVVGGGDAAMEDALALTRFAQSVKIIHRRDVFRASKTMIERVKKHQAISVLWNSAIEEIKGINFVEAIVVKNFVSREALTIPMDGVFVAIGHDPATAFLKGVIDLDEAGYVKTKFTYPEKTTMGESVFKAGYPTSTNLEGVFAAGDCVDFRYRQASTAAGYGVMAALDAERWLENK